MQYLYTPRQRILAAAQRAETKSTKVVRRKCFLSYHADDAEEVTAFIDEFGDYFIPKVLGVTDDDPWVNSENDDYIMECVRKKYLGDSTVTIVLVGRCTWARKFVDWEVYSSLRNSSTNKRNGVMAVTLKSAADHWNKKLPDRVADNVLGADGDDGYARWWKYPTSGEGLRSQIETAFSYRDLRTPVNSRARRTASDYCLV